MEAGGKNGKVILTKQQTEKIRIDENLWLFNSKTLKVTEMSKKFQNGSFFFLKRKCNEQHIFHEKHMSF